MHTKFMMAQTIEMRLAWGVASTVFMLLVLVGAPLSFAQEAQSKTFSSPVEASNALFQAAQKEDEQALEAILGAGKEVTSSSDEVEDKLERERFSQKYEEMHRLVREPDGSTVLYIGAENWPFPVPLLSKNGEWYFDSKAGAQEIKFRTVGENEATAIQVCEEFGLTKKLQDEKANSEDPITRFAQNLVSPGIPNAADESTPFHGYYFRMLAQNVAAGANGYVSGAKKKGLALVAYPAEYGSSGVKTFIVTWRGVVFEKDLGPGTQQVVPNLRTRDSGWRAAE
jgi:Protein of unknown function (DUF2950)